MTSFMNDKPDTSLASRISPEYLELQRQMHEVDNVYGYTGESYAEDVWALTQRYRATSILDYGCGKGTLKKRLADYDIDDLVREYDPAIPGKDHDPVRADLVVCTDVMEHIEDDRINSVLEHIRSLSAKATYFTISTRPAKKSLPDGRNAHISQHDAEWWKDRLSRFFEIKNHKVTPDSGIAVHCEPYLLIGDIVAIGVMSDDERYEHAVENVKFTKSRLQLAPPHDRVCLLACYGPSLESTWQTLLEEWHMINAHGKGADIVSVSGAHDYLIERGVIPQFHIECDPREHKGLQTKLLRDDVQYLYASCCHPSVVGRLAGKPNLHLWHLDGGPASRRIGRDLEPNALMIGGGGSVGLRAVPVMGAAGYRRFVIHGMDCSYTEDARTHAGDHAGKKPNVITVTSYGRKFKSSPVLLAYLKQFDDFRMEWCGSAPDKFEVVIRGDGLLQWSLKMTPGATEFQMPEEAIAANAA